MKSDIEFDPMFAPKGRRRYRPIRWFGALLVVVMLGGVALRAGSPPPTRSGPRPQVKAPIPGRAMVVQGPIQNPPTGMVRQRDRFVIIAREDIDPKMVVRAREDIDPEMVLNPETRRHGTTPIDPGPADNRVVPGPLAIPATGPPVPPR